MLILAGCVSAPPKVEARIAPDVVFSLPALPGDMEKIEASQIVFGDAGGAPIQFQSQIKLVGGQVAVVMVDSLGRRALEIDWSQSGVTVNAAPWLPEEVRPLNILADIVIAHWPVSDVRAGLSETGAVLRELENARVISRADDDLMRIEYALDFVPPWQGSLMVRNVALDYTLRIKSMSTEP